MEIHREVAFGYFETASVPLMTPERCKVSCREFCASPEPLWRP
jgi:hypothetical protein